MNDSHLHLDPATQTEVDYPGTRRDCVLCQSKAAEVSDKKESVKKVTAKVE